MKRMVYMCLFYLFISCDTYDNTPEKITIEKITSSEIKVEWFYYSTLLTSFPVYYVVLERSEEKDTICVSTNIANIKIIEEDNIEIGFYGSPVFRSKKINIIKESLFCQISIDTTYKRNYQK